MEFLALKWAVTDQFKEYLRYKPFTVRIDNNPLTYVMTTPNLDAIRHQWVATLTGYNMTIEYLKGADNKVADILSQVPQRLDLEAVTVLLNHARTSNVPRAEADNPRVMAEHQKIDEEVILQAQQMVRQDKHFWNLMNWDWVDSQMQDPVISQVIGWIQRPKMNKSTLDEFMKAKGVPESDQRFYAQWQSDFILRDNLLFIRVTPANSTETVSICGPGKKASGCYRRMSPECQSSRSRPDPESYERAILVAGYGSGTSLSRFQL